MQSAPRGIESRAIVSGMGKATNFEFYTHIHRIDRNESLFKISAKVAVTQQQIIFEEFQPI